jgi:hypothetical protein
MTSPSPFGTLDDLPDSVAVERDRSSLPRAVVALVVGGVVAAIVAVFIATSVVTVVEAGKSDECSLEAPCTDLSLDDVERGAGLDFPDGSEVLAASRADGVFTATVLLPGDELPKFALYGYGPAAGPSAELARTLEGVEGTPVQWFAASTAGVTGAAARLDLEGRTVIVVDVRTAG